MSLRGILAVSLLIVAGGHAEATIWTVDPTGGGDFYSIQPAIDAAANGDVVELVDWTYTGPGNRNISFYGKAVTVRSASGNPSACVIDLGYDTVNQYRAFQIQYGEGPATVIEGITMANGYSMNGGAIHCGMSSPTIRNCVFSGCYGATAGAILISNTASPEISDCVFIENESEAGGACFIEASTSFASLLRCIFIGNSAISRGGAVYCAGGTPARMEECEFYENSASAGGAAYCDYASPTFDRCVFSGNWCTAGGGAVHCQGSSAEIIGCTMAGNDAATGAGIHCRNSSHPTVENGILAFGLTGEAIWCDAGSSAELICSDVYGNAGGDWVGCIAGQEGTMGNFSSDPLFCDAPNGDLTLSADSPCLDAPGCGQVGALGEGCGGTTGVEQTSWGEIKRIFR